MVVFYVHYVFNPSIGAANPDRVAETNGPQQIQIQPVSSSEALGDDQWLNKTTGPRGGALLLITVHYIISMSFIFHGLTIHGGPANYLNGGFLFLLPCAPQPLIEALGWLQIRVTRYPISEQSIYDSRGIKCGLRGLWASAMGPACGCSVWLSSVGFRGSYHWLIDVRHLGSTPTTTTATAKTTLDITSNYIIIVWIMIVPWLWVYLWYLLL